MKHTNPNAHRPISFDYRTQGRRYLRTHVAADHAFGMLFPVHFDPEHDRVKV